MHRNMLLLHQNFSNVRFQGDGLSVEKTIRALHPGIVDFLPAQFVTVGHGANDDRETLRACGRFLGSSDPRNNVDGCYTSFVLKSVYKHDKVVYLRPVRSAVHQEASGTTTNAQQQQVATSSAYAAIRSSINTSRQQIKVKQEADEENGVSSGVPGSSSIDDTFIANGKVFVVKKEGEKSDAVDEDGSVEAREPNCFDLVKSPIKALKDKMFYVMAARHALALEFRMTTATITFAGTVWLRGESTST